jgi:hypothetical protein
VPKSFQEAFEEWKLDKRYQVGEDIGWEYSDNKEASPTLAKRSSTLKDNVRTTDSAEKVLGSGPQAG